VFVYVSFYKETSNSDLLFIFCLGEGGGVLIIGVHSKFILLQAKSRERIASVKGLSFSVNFSFLVVNPSNYKLDLSRVELGC